MRKTGKNLYILVSLAIAVTLLCGIGRTASAEESGSQYKLYINVTPATAAVAVTGAAGETITPDAASGAYLLDTAVAYSYSIKADTWQDVTGAISGIDAGWTVNSGEQNSYIMVVAMKRMTKQVTLGGNNATLTDTDGNALASATVDYEGGLTFKAAATEGYWITQVTAVMKSAAASSDIWDGSAALEYEGGSGTKDDPYLIANGAQLACLAQDVNSGMDFEGNYFKLVANLDLASLPWTTIGNNSENCFSGTFDGNGHVIRNLKLQSTAGYAMGLFGYLTGGTVTDLGMADCVITNNLHTGGIAGRAINGVINNCWVTGSVTASKSVGGIVGSAMATTINNCWNGAAISGGNQIGGIVGSMASGCTTDGCWNTGAVTTAVKNAAVGGLVGKLYSNCTLRDSYNSGAVTNTGAYALTEADSSINCYGTGGVIGGMSCDGSDESSVSGCWNSGAVTADNGRVGGVVGNLVNGQVAYLTVDSCYNTGIVNMSNASHYAGGIVGRASGAAAGYILIENSYNTGTVSGDGNTGAALGDGSLTGIKNSYALEGTAAVLYQGDSVTADSASGILTAVQLQSGRITAALGNEFVEDAYSVNSGYPVHSWLADMQIAYGDYVQLPVTDNGDGSYTIGNVLDDVTVTVSTRANVTAKSIYFQVEPDSQVGDIKQITVLDSDGNAVQPDTEGLYALTVGETYTYTIAAAGYETVEDELAVTMDTCCLIKVRMRESVPEYNVKFQPSNSHVTVYVNDEPVTGSVTVQKDDTLPFYVEVQSGYELVGVTANTGETTLDVWDGSSVDTSWYSPDLTSYTITKASELAGVQYLVRNGLATFQGMTLYLGADLDMTAANFQSIGGCYVITDKYYFMGTFDGQSHTITVNMNGATTTGARFYTSLFGLTDGATIRNLTLAGNISSGVQATAGFVVEAKDTVISNCINLANVSSSSSAAGFLLIGSGTTTISDCFNGGDITGDLGVSGIIGGNTTNSIANVIRCGNAGTITATEVGHGTGAAGIMGCCSSADTIDQCYNVGTIISYACWVGGITTSLAGTVTNSYNMGSVQFAMPAGDIYSYSGYVGGIAGSASYAATVKNCYNAGSVTCTGGGGGQIGSFVGSMGLGVLTNYTNNYWLNESELNAFGNTGSLPSYGERQIKGLTSDELKNCYSTLGDDLWRQDNTGINDGYPILRNSPTTGSESALKYLGDGDYLVTDIQSNVTVRVIVVCIHNYVETVITAPTCTESGEVVYRCTRCGATYTAALPALGHNYDENGVCTRCGATRGDLNGDNTVDMNDLSLLLNGYGGTDAACDINCDGVVNLNDLSLLLNAYGHTMK